MILGAAYQGLCASPGAIHEIGRFRYQPIFGSKTLALP